MKKDFLLHQYPERLKLTCIGIILCMETLSISAQSENRKDSIHGTEPYREQTLPVPHKAEVPSELQKYASPIIPENSSSTLNNKNFVPATIHYDYTKEKKLPKEMEPSHTNPYNGNFASGGYMMLDRNSYLSGEYSYSALPIIGSIRESNLFYNRSLGSSLNFTGGIYGAKMMMVGLSRQGVFNDFGFKGSLEWKVNNWLSFRGFGTYSVNKPHYSLAMNPFVENTNYGGTIRVMFNEHFGVEGGVTREFNPFTGKWKTYPVIYPIIKFGK